MGKENHKKEASKGGLSRAQVDPMACRLTERPAREVDGIRVYFDDLGNRV